MKGLELYYRPEGNIVLQTPEKTTQNLSNACNHNRWFPSVSGERSKQVINKAYDCRYKLTFQLFRSALEYHTLMTRWRQPIIGGRWVTGVSRFPGGLGPVQSRELLKVTPCNLATLFSLLYSERPKLANERVG